MPTTTRRRRAITAKPLSQNFLVGYGCSTNLLGLATCIKKQESSSDRASMCVNIKAKVSLQETILCKLRLKTFDLYMVVCGFFFLKIPNCRLNPPPPPFTDFNYCLLQLNFGAISVFDF